jgi:hypothetical protein
VTRRDVSVVTTLELSEDFQREGFDGTVRAVKPFV